MYGNIRAISEKNGFIAVETENVGFSVIELVGGYDVEIDDVIVGNLELLGSEEVYNKTQDEEMDVFIQNCNCDWDCVRRLMQS